jgi:ERF superfamily
MTITHGIGATENIGELAGALAKAQSEFKPVLKDTVNPYFNSKYADLSSVIGATQQALSKNGLVVIQNPVVDCETEKAGVTTILAHSSGQWMSHDLMLPATMKGKDGAPKFDAQSVGSAITYARRYSYQAIVGVAAEMDDDGNAAALNGGSREAAQAVAQRKIAEHKARQQTQTGPVRSNIPAVQTDPHIEAAEIVKAGGQVRKPFLAVKWDRKKLTCFEVVGKQDMKPLWKMVLANIGKPADFVVVQNGQYFNIEGIKRLNGHDYAQDQAELDAGTLEPELGEYEEPLNELA